MAYLIFGAPTQEMNDQRKRLSMHATTDKFGRPVPGHGKRSYPRSLSILGIYDTTTASGRPLNAVLVRELVTERMHRLPTFRCRLAAVPFDLDYP